MSTDNFVKGECQACGGHLEFPAVAAGQTIECPHCQQSTPLLSSQTPTTTGLSPQIKLIIAVAVSLLVFIPTLVLCLKQFHFVTQPVPATQVTSIPAPAPATMVPAKPKYETQTNDFGISAIKLEKTPGSSLVYATGKVRNLGAERRYGVRLELNLFDKQDQPIGLAKDYQALLEPGAEWRFKALIMESKAAYARLSSIHEDQQ